MANNSIQPGRVMDYHNVTEDDILSGDVVAFDDGIGVAMVDILPDDTGSVGMTGVWELPKATGEALAQGKPVNWATDKVQATGGVPAGRVWETAAVGSETVQVKIG